MNLSSCLVATGQKLRIPEIVELRIEKFPRPGGIAHTPSDQQLRHDRWYAGRAPQRRDSFRFVRVDAPSLRHGKNDRPCSMGRSGIRGQESEVRGQGIGSRKLESGILYSSFIPYPSSFPPAYYFFFSVCSVCLRHRGQYFCTDNFSPPGLRRRV
jgi:hypothetical protein